MDDMLNTPRYEDLGEPTITYRGTCLEDSNNTESPPSSTEEVYQSDTTESETASATNPMEQVHSRDWSDDSASTTSKTAEQACHYEVISPPAISPFKECEDDSDQVKFLKSELKAVRVQRDLFQNHYWRLRAEIVWLLSVFHKEMENKRDLKIELMIVQFNQLIEEMNQNHRQKVLDHVKMQYGNLVDKIQRQKCQKEITDLENSTRRVMDETGL
jgi:hypothetical protein